MAASQLAKNIMVKRLVTLTAEQNVLHGIRLLLKHQISGAPVIDGSKRFVGMFSEKCCMSLLSKEARLATESGKSERIRHLQAKDIMKTKLITLTPETDVFEAIDYLLKNHISGAPVVDGQGHFLGVFSEKTSMNVLIESAYSQLPTTRVEYFMNSDQGRTINEQTDALTVARMFLETPYRRLVVLRDGRVTGLISRREVLSCELRLADGIWNESLLDRNPPPDISDTVLIGGGMIRKQPPRISEHMDTHAKTIHEDVDLLSIAHIFRETPHRRLPVLRDGFLVGQISRRDLLQAAHSMMEVSASSSLAESSILYLSSLKERHESPFQS